MRERVSRSKRIGLNAGRSSPRRYETSVMAREEHSPLASEGIFKCTGKCNQARAAGHDVAHKPAARHIRIYRRQTVFASRDMRGARSNPQRPSEDVMPDNSYDAIVVGSG